MDLNDIKNELLKELPPKTTAPRILDFLLIGFRDMCMETFAFSEDLTFLSVVGQKEYTLTPTISNVNINTVLRGDIGTMPAPIVSLSTDTSGGAIVAATYYYRVSATGIAGETLASLETSITTTGGTSTVTLTWDAIDGATGYKVYLGRETGTAELMVTYSDGSWDADPVGTGTSLLWVDDGSIAPLGDLPKGDIFLKPLSIKNPGTLQTFDPGWTSGYDDSTELSGIKSFSFNGINTILLSRVPRIAAIPFRIKISMYPNESFASSTALNALFEQYREALKDFCKWKFYSLSPLVNKWADPKMAVFHRSLYEKEKNSLKLAVIYEHGGSSSVFPNNSIGGYGRVNV